MFNDLFQPGDMLQERYTITRIHRVSGMSTLYEAEAQEQLYVIKEALIQDDDDMLFYDVLEEFKLVAESLLQVDHPHIPAIVDYFIDGDRTYLVTEFVRGKDLESLINEANGSLSIKQVYEWGVALADTINYLHTLEPHPIVYRDLKPANIMVEEDGNVKLIDFGIAIVHTDPPRVHLPLGTDGYAAPEQYMGDAFPLIDVYGLGATLHHLLSGTDPRLEPPFSFDKRPLRQYNAQIPEPLEVIVMTAVSYNSWERFDSMADMLSALHEVRPFIEALGK